MKHKHKWIFERIELAFCGPDREIYKCKCGARKVKQGDSVTYHYLEGGFVV